MERVHGPFIGVRARGALCTARVSRRHVDVQGPPLLDSGPTVTHSPRTGPDAGPEARRRDEHSGHTDSRPGQTPPRQAPNSCRSLCRVAVPDLPLPPLFMSLPTLAAKHRTSDWLALFREISVTRRPCMFISLSWWLYSLFSGPVKHSGQSTLTIYRAGYHFRLIANKEVSPCILHGDPPFYNWHI